MHVYNELYFKVLSLDWKVQYTCMTISKLEGTLYVYDSQYWRVHFICLEVSISIEGYILSVWRSV